MALAILSKEYNSSEWVPIDGDSDPGLLKDVSP
jgi:hypothetical protein